MIFPGSYNYWSTINLRATGSRYGASKNTSPSHNEREAMFRALGARESFFLSKSHSTICSIRRIFRKVAFSAHFLVYKALPYAWEPEGRRSICPTTRLVPTTLVSGLDFFFYRFASFQENVHHRPIIPHVVERDSGRPQGYLLPNNHRPDERESIQTTRSFPTSFQMPLEISWTIGAFTGDPLTSSLLITQVWI